jgi:hypothetical protein
MTALSNLWVDPLLSKTCAESTQGGWADEMLIPGTSTPARIRSAFSPSFEPSPDNPLRYIPTPSTQPSPSPTPLRVNSSSANRSSTPSLSSEGGSKERKDSQQALEISSLPMRNSTAQPTTIQPQRSFDDMAHDPSRRRGANSPTPLTQLGAVLPRQSSHQTLRSEYSQSSLNRIPSALGGVGFGGDGSDRQKTGTSGGAASIGRDGGLNGQASSGVGLGVQGEPATSRLRTGMGSMRGNRKGPPPRIIIHPSTPIGGPGLGAEQQAGGMGRPGGGPGRPGQAGQYGKEETVGKGCGCLIM